MVRSSLHPVPAGEEQTGVLPPPQPPERPRDDGFLGEAVALGRYLAQSEVHTYAFSVAANAILSLFPFIVMMFTLAHRVFHSRAMESVIGEMIRFFLPTGQEFVAKNMSIVANARHEIQVFSVVMLFISSTGVFLPLEVALNQVWHVTKNRSYLMNQVVSLGLALIMAALAMGAVLLNASQRYLLGLLFFGHVDNAVFRFLSGSLLELTTIVAGIALFFFIYWMLPNRKLPARAVLPTAVVIGLLWELAKIVYVALLPRLNFKDAYGPFYISVSLIIWAYVTGLLMLGGAHYSATRYARRVARIAEVEKRRSEALPA